MRTKTVRRWLAGSGRLVHLSVLLFLPLIVFAVIEVGQVSEIGYFVFPPLASATFTIFFDPEGAYSTPARLVGGLTLSAVVGSA
ncbi:MAG: HPP family protein [Candidatus Nanohaloarchaea archaeon]